MSVGIGDKAANLSVYIANRPPLEEYRSLNELRPLVKGDIQYISNETGNHWRKIFNCYAKLCFCLDGQNYSTWQNYRDERLLQLSSQTQLLFSSPDLRAKSRQVHLVSGRTYYQSLSLRIPVEWLDSYFAVSFEYRLIVTPYFDYRQLSNARIEFLVGLINQLK